MGFPRRLARLCAATILVVGTLAGCSSPKPLNGPRTSGPITPTPPGCSLPAGTATGLSAPPTGLVAFAIYQPGTIPFPDEVFTNSAVSGVDLLMQWDNIEKTANAPDWSVLDCVFAQAVAHNKFVALALMPGFRSPPWVLALPGVQTQSFKFSYNGTAPARPLPLPWNTAYLNAWFTFLGAVAGRYGTNQQFRLIQVAGPTSVSTEMSLPDSTSGDTALPASAHGSDIAEWMSLGYTPDKYVRAWTQSFDQYHSLFPNQHLGLALYPGLPIGNDGAEDPEQPVATVMSVIAAGMRYKQQFDVQEDGIKGISASTPSDPEYNAVRAYCGTVVTGFQNAMSATQSPTDQGSQSNALAHVTAAGVDFWEVYTSDVDNSSMNGVLTQASEKLPASKQCGQGGGQFEQFESAEGNVTCEMGFDSNHKHYAACYIGNYTYKPPAKPEDCHRRWGDSLYLEEGSAGVLQCDLRSLGPKKPPHDLPTPPALSYGETRSVGPITCENEPAGMTCTDASSGHYFLVAAESYQLG